MPESGGKIKILLLLSSTAGGTGLHAYYLAKYINREEFDLTVAFGAGYPMDEKIAELGVPVIHLSIARKISPLTNLRGLFQLYRLLRKNHYDILCIGNAIAGFLGRLVGWLAHVPSRVFVIHAFASHLNQSPPRRAVFRLIEKLLDPFTTHYVAVAGAMKRFGVERGIIRHPDKAEVIYNGIPMDTKPGASAKQIRAELGLKPESLVIGTLARFETQKGLEYLIEAAALIRKKFSAVEYLLVGDGPLKSELQEQVTRLGLEDVVKFPGWRADAANMFACMDIFCMPSLWEAMPFTLLEAMALERPVVATGVDGIPEVVADGETGFLVPPRDSLALADKLLVLLRDEDCRRGLGKAACRRVEQEFTVECMVRQYQELFQRLTQGRRKTLNREADEAKAAA